MPRPPYSINATPRGWMVCIPRQYGAGRVRKHFKDRATAEQWALDALPAVKRGLDAPLAPWETAMYRAARMELDQAGDVCSVLDAVRSHLSHSRRLNAFATGTVAEFSVDFIAAKRAQGLREVSVNNAAYALKKLPQDVSPGRIDVRQVEALVAGLSPEFRNLLLKHWRIFFGWLLARNLVPSNPAAKVPFASKDWKPPAIYTPAEAAALLAGAMVAAPSLVSRIAVGLWAGVRTSALLKLVPADVDLKQGILRVSGAADKLRASYIADIRPPLDVWLAAYPLRRWPHKAGNWHRLFRAAHDAAGLAYRSNGMRHSCASYLLASGHPGGANHVAAQLGQWESVATLLHHYRHLVTPAAAAEYATITPNSVKLLAAEIKRKTQTAKLQRVAAK